MNKIILQFGLLSFFVSIIIFSQQGIPLQDVIIRAFVVFVILTIMISILVIVFIKFINKTSYEKQKELSENLAGSTENE